MMSKAEKNLNSMNANKARELDVLRAETQQQQEQIQELKKKLSAAVARKDTLDNQSKDLKQTFQSKIQILIEKTENDDKLINMLKDEVRRLEQLKGVKSSLQGGKGVPLQQNSTDELIKLRGENGRLKNQVKCGEIEL